jgi:hypothetical protein
MIAAVLIGLAFAWTNEYPPLYRAEPVEIDSLLADARWAGLDLEGKLLALSRLRVGTPYALGSLGEEAGPDRDPLFRLDLADCTVLVVTDAALLHARSLDDARAWMRRIHYRDGEPSYATRYHFTIDRIGSSPYFEEITARAAPDSLLRTVRVHLNRTEAGGRLLEIPWSRKIAARYLPSALVTEEILDRLPAACGVAFVSERNIPRGFLVSHEGVLLERRLLQHASSAKGSVIETPLLAYLGAGGGGAAFDGVVFFAFR